MEVTDDHTKRQMPLKEEFCYFEFLGGEACHTHQATRGSTRFGPEAGGVRRKRGWKPVFAVRQDAVWWGHILRVRKQNIGVGVFVIRL